VAANLAIVTAQAGLKTLLLSADLRRPTVAKTFGLKREPGLSELIMGTVKPGEVMDSVLDILLGEMGFEGAMATPGLDNIWVIPSGRLHSQPVELLESKEFGSLLETFKAGFDVVILDSPPILPVTDASILARKVDCAIIVYEIGRTSRGALMRTKMQLESVGAKISGVLINNTNPQVEPIASYNYYRQYQYYGKEKIDEHAGKPVA
jgi:capsular exopolysaccharide synthesis family protein